MVSAVAILKTINRYIPNSLIKHALEVALSQGRAFEVLMRTNILGAEESLVV